MRSVANTGLRELVLVCVCICMRGLLGSLLKAVHHEEIACRKTHKSLPLCVHNIKSLYLVLLRICTCRRNHVAADSLPPAAAVAGKAEVNASVVDQVA